MGCQFLSNAKYGWVWSIFLYLISFTPIFGFFQLRICLVNTMRSCTEKELLARPPPLWRFWFLKRENKNCIRCIFYHSGEEKFCLKCDRPEATFGSGHSRLDHTSAVSKQLETCSNVVSSTMEDEDSSSREGLTPLSNIKVRNNFSIHWFAI